MSGAGATSLADVEPFEPGAGWSPAERLRLLGVQASLPDEATVWQRLLPRLDAVARRGWHG